MQREVHAIPSLARGKLFWKGNPKGEKDRWLLGAAAPINLDQSADGFGTEKARLLSRRVKLEPLPKCRPSTVHALAPIWLQWSHHPGLHASLITSQAQEGPPGS